MRIEHLRVCLKIAICFTNAVMVHLIGVRLGGDSHGQRVSGVGGESKTCVRRVVMIMNS